jgi:hypothetical protein
VSEVLNIPKEMHKFGRGDKLPCILAAGPAAVVVQAQCCGLKIRALTESCSQQFEFLCSVRQLQVQLCDVLIHLQHGRYSW